MNGLSPVINEIKMIIILIKLYYFSNVTVYIISLQRICVNLALLFHIYLKYIYLKLAILFML